MGKTPEMAYLEGILTFNKEFTTEKERLEQSMTLINESLKMHINQSK